MCNKLKIYVLSENTASGNCRAEHGLSYIVVYDKSIIFDTGKSNLFLENAHTMKLDIDDIDTVVLSHGHYDHGNGLKYLKDKMLICHPNIFTTRFSGKQMKPAGIDISRNEAKQQFNLLETVVPYKLSEKMWFLGEIPREFDFEKTSTYFYLRDKTTDDLRDDSALVVEMEKGLFIISGCAHSGICNIIEYARKITGVDKVFGVLGGFHLKHNNRQTKETIAYLQHLNVKVVMPSHCTDLPALSAMYAEFKGVQVKAGGLYTFE